MAKPRTKKEHKLRVAKRNNKIAQEKKQFEKMQKNLLMKLIDEENKKGLFNNQPNIPGFPQIPVIDGPSLGIEGPKI